MDILDNKDIKDIDNYDIKKNIIKKINTKFSTAKYLDKIVIIMNENGYVNGSKLCSLYNRELSEYCKLKRCTYTMQFITNTYNIPIKEQTVYIEKNEPKKVLGKYVHYKLLVDIIKWIYQSYSIYINNDEYLYLSTSKLFLGVKIGYWTGKKCRLKSRYKTYYGDDVKIFIVKVYDGQTSEYDFKNKFRKYHITREIYELDYYDKYKKYLLFLKSQDESDNENE